MRIGLVGYPGAGKSTVFGALTGIAVETGYGSGKENVGAVKVPDPRVDALSALYSPKKTTYAEHVGAENLKVVVKKLMQEQHKAMFIALRDGIYDKKNDEVWYGSGALIDLADYSSGMYYSGQLEDGKKIVFEFQSEGDDVGGGDPPPGECLPKGASCTNDTECCSLDCKRSFTCR